MARRRFQTGWLFKRGERRKVWVARWRETAVFEDGKVKQVRRSVVLGTVADLPKKADAQVRLEEHAEGRYGRAIAPSRRYLA